MQNVYPPLFTTEDEREVRLSSAQSKLFLERYQGVFQSLLQFHKDLQDFLTIMGQEGVGFSRLAIDETNNDIAIYVTGVKDGREEETPPVADAERKD